MRAPSVSPLVSCSGVNLTPARWASAKPAARTSPEAHSGIPSVGTVDLSRRDLDPAGPHGPLAGPLQPPTGRRPCATQSDRHEADDVGIPAGPPHEGEPWSSPPIAVDSNRPASDLNMQASRARESERGVRG